MQCTGNNNKASTVDGRELVWKKERELGNSSQVGVKKVCVLEGRDMCSTAPNRGKNTFCSTGLKLGYSYLNYF